MITRFYHPYDDLLKIGECLYRYTGNGQYYALLKIRGKQIKKSLRTDNLPEARRKLKELKRDYEHVDPNIGKITFSAMIDKYLLTIQHQSDSTRDGKTRICNKIRQNWPGGTNRQISKINPSEAEGFLSTYPGVSLSQPGPGSTTVHFRPRRPGWNTRPLHRGRYKTAKNLFV